MQGTVMGFPENADDEEEVFDICWVPIMFQGPV